MNMYRLFRYLLCGDMNRNISDLEMELGRSYLLCGDMNRNSICYVVLNSYISYLLCGDMNRNRHHHTPSCSYSRYLLCGDMNRNYNMVTVGQASILSLTWRYE